MTDNGLLALAQTCSNLVTINLNNCWSVTDIGVSAIARNCPHLGTLILQNYNISDVNILAIAHNCHELLQVSLCQDSIESYQIRTGLCKS